MLVRWAIISSKRGQKKSLLKATNDIDYVFFFVLFKTILLYYHTHTFQEQAREDVS